MRSTSKAWTQRLACGVTAVAVCGAVACGDQAGPTTAQPGSSGASTSGASASGSGGVATAGQAAGGASAGMPSAGATAGAAGVAALGGMATGGGATGGSAGNAGNGSGGGVSNPDPSAPCPKCVRVFNGKDYEGWEAAPATWTIVGDAMQGKGGSSRAAYTKADYGNFRLFVTSRMTAVNGDHLGILFWGKRPTSATSPEIDHNDWMQWMPPSGTMWSYPAAMHHEIKPTKLAASPAQNTVWSTAELLFNLDQGTLRAAVDGVEITLYEHAKANPSEPIVKGPLAMMRHGGGTSEYKDIFVEVEPSEDKLYSVKAK